MIKKAVLPAAGLGTRFLPASKATPKEMLSIIDKPLIQYAVEEAINAGINEKRLNVMNRAKVLKSYVSIDNTAVAFVAIYNSIAMVHALEVAKVKQRQGFGLYTAGQVSGGNDVSGNALGICEQYDGSSWTEVADMSNARWGVAGAGTTSAFVAMGGYIPPGNTASQLTSPIQRPPGAVPPPNGRGSVQCSQKGLQSLHVRFREFKCH